MATVRLHLDQSRVTIGALMDLEDLAAAGNAASVRKIHDALCNFVVDEAGAPLAFEDASAQIRQLTVDEMMGSIQTLNSTLQEQAVPPTTGSA